MTPNQKLTVFLTIYILALVLLYVTALGIAEIKKRLKQIPRSVRVFIGG